MPRYISVLMTRQNPEGWKLEELAARLAEEVEAKTANVVGDPSPAAETLRHNNAEVVVRLREIVRLQEHTLKVLSEIGPDQGPKGKPRIGSGS